MDIDKLTDKQFISCIKDKIQGISPENNANVSVKTIKRFLKISESIISKESVEVKADMILKTDESSYEVTPETYLAFEQWINSDVANEAYDKFGIGLRVHISQENK